MYLASPALLPGLPAAHAAAHPATPGLVAGPAPAAPAALPPQAEDFLARGDQNGSSDPPLLLAFGALPSAAGPPRDAAARALRKVRAASAARAVVGTARSVGLNCRPREKIEIEKDRDRER